MNEKTNKYTAKDIQILPSREAVRKRPGMYIGNVEHAVEQACRELIANAIDEHLAGYGSTITMEFTEMGIKISDEGRGVPLMRKDGTFCDHLFTALHAGSTADGHAPHIHLSSIGCGLAPLNFLAKRMKITTWRDHPLSGDRHQWNLEYSCGELIEQSSRPDVGIGTIVEWEPDPDVLGSVETRRGLIRRELWDSSHLFSGLRFDFDGEIFLSRDGLLDLAWLNYPFSPSQRGEPKVLHFSETIDNFIIEIAALSKTNEDPTLLGWVNGVRAPLGSHIEGLRAGLINTNYAVGLIHVMMLEPAFAGPTRDEIDMPKLNKIVERVVQQNVKNVN